MIDEGSRPQIPNDHSFGNVWYSLFMPWISLWTSRPAKMEVKYHWTLIKCFEYYGLKKLLCFYKILFLKIVLSDLQRLLGGLQEKVSSIDFLVMKL